MLDDLIKEAKLLAYSECITILLEEALISGYSEQIKKIESKIETKKVEL